MTPPTTPPSTADAAVRGAVATLEQAVEGLAGLDVDVLDEGGIGQVLGGAERSIRRLQALQARLANTLSRRRAQAARAQRPDDPRAAQKAARAVRGELTDQLGITPSQSKQLVRTGAQLEHLPRTSDAYRQGLVTGAHVRVIDEVTAHFAGDRRARFEEELVALAQRCRDAVEFGRQARGRLIELDHDAAMEDLDRKKARRSGRVAQGADGTTHLALDTAGYAGELVHTVVDAFRTPDGPGQHRTAEQRTHDAVMAAFETALRAGTASTQHGVRPHVALVVRAESIRPRTGAAGTNWTGPLPYAEVARLLGDCSLTRIVADATDAPLSVSGQVRTVPMGLWRLLVVRDGGCIMEGCDAPPGWCQVAHLDEWFVDGGKLSPDTAGLLCTAGNNRHAMFDRGALEVSWVEGRPVVATSSRQPDDRPSPIRPSLTRPSPTQPSPDDTAPGQRLASEARAVYAARPRATDRAGPRPIGRPSWSSSGRSSTRSPARSTARSRARSP